jgi:HisJ family histidinol phosphate phosphatase
MKERARLIIGGAKGKKADFHLHSDFSDGKSSIEKMSKTAVEMGYQAICFTDHVRRDTLWLDKYLIEIKRVRNIFPDIMILSGIEAKAIDTEGNLDIKDDFVNKVDIVIASIHRLPKGRNEYFGPSEFTEKERILHYWLAVTKGMIKNSQADIIGHPTISLDRSGIALDLDYKKELAIMARECGKIIEVNIKYKTPDREFICCLAQEGVLLSCGSDSHSVEELRSYSADWNGGCQYVI